MIQNDFDTVILWIELLEEGLSVLYWKSLDGPKLSLQGKKCFGITNFLGRCVKLAVLQWQCERSNGGIKILPMLCKSSLMFRVTEGDIKPLRSRMMFSWSTITWHDVTTFSFPFILPRDYISDLFDEWLIYCCSCKTLSEVFWYSEIISIWSNH